ncbi:hypothetical protein E2I00_012123, partial [Balaenoptera physalus]
LGPPPPPPPPPPESRSQTRRVSAQDSGDCSSAAATAAPAAPGGWEETRLLQTRDLLPAAASRDPDPSPEPALGGAGRGTQRLISILSIPALADPSGGSGTGDPGVPQDALSPRPPRPLA